MHKHITDIGNMTQKFPDWVLKYKNKGVAIEKRGDSYYASKITSNWNPIKKRAQKKTVEYLGKVTPDGIIPPWHKRDLQIGGILEAGHFVFLKRFIKNISGPLVEMFPDDWESILSTACFRLCYQEPFSRMKIRHDTSLSKRFWPTAALNMRNILPLISATFSAIVKTSNGWKSAITPKRYGGHNLRYF